jgi:hypothetical protein
MGGLEADFGYTKAVMEAPEFLDCLRCQEMSLNKEFAAETEVLADEAVLAAVCAMRF